MGSSLASQVTYGFGCQGASRRLPAKDEGTGLPARATLAADVRSEQFAREARRQAALVARTDRHSDDKDFIEAVSVTW